MKHWHLLIIVLFSTNVFCQFKKYPQMLGAFEKLSSSNESNSNPIFDENNYVELIEKRDLFSAHYEAENGNIKSIYSNTPIHYYNHLNQLVPIQTELVPINENLYGALSQPYPTYLKTNGQFGITLKKNAQVFLGEIVSISDRNLKTPEVNIDAKGMELLSLAAGMDKQLFFLENGVKYSYVLTEEFLPNENDLIITEKIDAPDYVSFEFDEQQIKEQTGYTTGDILMKDKRNGEILGRISVPYCYDENHNSILGSFQLEQKMNRFCFI